MKFYRSDGGTLVVADISGLPPDSETGIFALHIHEGTDCSGPGFSDTGGHFNPTGQLHPNHAGDLPPLFSFRGRAFLAVLTGRFRVSDVIGRTVVIHSGPDDFKTQPSGNSGAKIACGIIRAV
ncbi:MAG: superoxide dismutase family protein [Candidatus Onthomonas sp.]